MTTTINWILDIEKRAGRLYALAGDKVTDNAQLSTFLRQLADDEQSHYHLLEKAAECLAAEGGAADLQIVVDEKTAAQIEKPFIALENILAAENLSHQELLQCIADAELSEWNEIFLYVIRSYSAKGRSKDIQYAAAAIQSHEQRIRTFLERLPSSFKPIDQFRTLPHIWERSILVVDDDEALRLLMAAILTSLGKVQTASNGKEALDRARDEYFDIIVSDIDMPVMNGVDFFQQAIQSDQQLIGHFIFCSGDLTQEREDMFNKFAIPCLQKPFDIFDLQDTARNLIER